MKSCPAEYHVLQQLRSQGEEGEEAVTVGETHSDKKL